MSNHRFFHLVVAILAAALSSLTAAGERKEVKEPKATKFAFKGHDAPIRSLSFSPDGKLLVSRGDDGAVWLWDLVEGKANRRLGKTAEKAVGAIVAFAPGNRKVVVADGKLDRALPLFQQAAAGVEQFDFAHRRAGQIVANLCRCHEQLKQHDQAEVWRRKWVAAKHRSLD